MFTCWSSLCRISSLLKSRPFIVASSGLMGSFDSMVDTNRRHAEVNPKTTFHLSHGRQHLGLGVTGRSPACGDVSRRLGMVAATGEESLRKEPPGRARVAPQSVPPGMPAAILALPRARGCKVRRGKVGNLLLYGSHGGYVNTPSAAGQVRVSQRFNTRSSGRDRRSVGATPSPIRGHRRKSFAHPFTTLAPLVGLS